MVIPLIPQDKANHFIYGAVVAFIVSLVVSPVLALAATAVVAVGKELSDWYQNTKGGSHGVEGLDAVATIIGGVMVVLPQLINK